METRRCAATNFSCFLIGHRYSCDVDSIYKTQYFARPSTHKESIRSTPPSLAPDIVWRRRSGLMTANDIEEQRFMTTPLSPFIPPPHETHHVAPKRACEALDNATHRMAGQCGPEQPKMEGMTLPSVVYFGASTWLINYPRSLETSACSTIRRWRGRLKGPAHLLFSVVTPDVAKMYICTDHMQLQALSKEQHQNPKVATS